MEETIIKNIGLTNLFIELRKDPKNKHISLYKFLTTPIDEPFESIEESSEDSFSSEKHPDIKSTYMSDILNGFINYDKYVILITGYFS